MVDFDRFKKGDLVRIAYVVPKGTPLVYGKTGVIVMKIVDITKKCIWGEQTKDSKFWHRGRMKFWKEFVQDMEVIEAKS